MSNIPPKKTPQTLLNQIFPFDSLFCDRLLTVHLFDFQRECFLVEELEDERLADAVAMSRELLLEALRHLVCVERLICCALFLQELRLQH